ncbi:MAG TPA: hypothetical protein VLS90_05125, partial [Thermodesulfobacteriota bacterium]|nr:hypothetical protein [Thermodesulfobacteriota bacterium]
MNYRRWLPLFFVFPFFLLLAWFSSTPAFGDASELENLQTSMRAQRAQWTAGETSVSALPPDERRRLLGLMLPSPELAHRFKAQEMVSAPAAAPPARFDWRDADGKGANFVTPVRNQG